MTKVAVDFLDRASVRLRHNHGVPTINDRAHVAAQSAAADELSQLASDKSPKVRAAVAGNPATPVQVLRDLAADENWHVRFAVAENPAPHALEIALKARDPDTRGRAAQRDDLHAAGVEIVLGDPVHTVRQRLAEVANTPAIAASLARDAHPIVRSSVVLNKHLSEVDVELLANDRLAQVRASAAASRRVRPETLTRLAGDRSAVVRWAVLVNNPERLDLARRIANDSDEMNANQAQAQLDSPRQFTAFLGDIDLIP